MKKEANGGLKVMTAKPVAGASMRARSVFTVRLAQEQSTTITTLRRCKMIKSNITLIAVAALMCVGSVIFGRRY